MHADLLSWLRFYVLRIARVYPIALAVGALLFALGLATGLFLLGLIRHEVVVRRDISAAMKSLSQPAAPATSQGSGRIDLPRFEPNKFVEAINRLAVNTKLPLDEVSFILEDNRTLPYLRYRATLSVSAHYPAVRRFLDGLQADQPQVALDAISCERDDIGAADTACDVSLSAFYQRQDRG